MHAKYIKREIPDLNGTGRTQACYKMELTPMTFQDFVTLCHREGGMDESQILGALSLVSEKLALCMAEGFSVKLDGIGTFNARLGVRDDMLQDAFEKGETSRNAQSIIVKGVSYRADKDLIRKTSCNCTLERGGESRLKKSPFTLEERIRKACEFLKVNHFMKVPDYVQLTGLSRTTAADGRGITKAGTRPLNRHYKSRRQKSEGLHTARIGFHRVEGEPSLQWQLIFMALPRRPRGRWWCRTSSCR